MQIAHLYFKRQLWRLTSMNKLWKAHHQLWKRYRPAAKYGRPGSVQKKYQSSASTHGSVIDKHLYNGSYIYIRFTLSQTSAYSRIEFFITHIQQKRDEILSTADDNSE